MKILESKLRRIVREAIESDVALSVSGDDVTISEATLRKIVTRILSEIDIDYGRMSQQDYALQTQKQISKAKGPANQQTKEQREAEQQLKLAMETVGNIVNKLIEKQFSEVSKLIPQIQNSLQNLFISLSSDDASNKIANLTKLFRQFHESFRSKNYNVALTSAKNMYTMMQNMGDLVGNKLTDRNISRS